MKGFRWVAVTIAAGLAGTATGATVAEPQGFFEQFVRNRLEIGARINSFELKDDRRSDASGYDNWNLSENFIGSIWGLDDEQSYWPRLYVQYMIVPYFGVGLTYDSITASTVDWGNEEQTRKSSDGDVCISGPLFYLVGCFPNESRFRPFLELGYAVYSADFDENSAWASVAPGYRFGVDDTDGWFWGIGCNIRVYENWNVDLYYRQMRDNVVDARAYFNPGPRPGRVGEFPLEYDMFSIGASYRF